MFKHLSRFLLYKVMGWKTEVSVQRPKKYVIALAPHTSNWDFLMGQLYCHAEGFKCNFMMKKEWFFWPLGPIFRSMGGIPVVRDKKTSLTDQMAAAARDSETFGLCITPEGTRRATSEWKRGFYYIAQKADIPVLLFGLDYGRKRIVCTKSIRPNGAVEKQMDEIKQYFIEFKGKKPENFII